MPLTIHTIANMFVKLQGHRRRVASKLPNRDHPIRSSSGDAPQNHPTLIGVPSEPGVKLRREDFFVCADGVDASKLLRATRTSLLDEARSIGGNALVEEQWSCTICGPKSRRSGYFNVKIIYTATAVSIITSDPGKPVALLKAKSVPGLMTIVQRKNVL